MYGNGKRGQVLVRTPGHKTSSQLRLESDSLRFNAQPFSSTARPSKLQRDVCELKKRTGFGPHPSGTKLKANWGGGGPFGGSPRGHFPRPQAPLNGTGRCANYKSGSAWDTTSC